MSRDALRLLRENRAFRNLWLAEAGSLLGSWFNTVAVLSLLTGLTQSGVTLSVYFVSKSLPGILLAPLMGALVDRLPRKPLLVAMDLTRVGLALGYILVRSPDDLWLAYATAVLMGLADSIFYPAWRAALPGVVSARQLPAANALGSSTYAVTVVLGAALGGTVAALLSPTAGFLVNSLSFAYSGLLILITRIPEVAREAAPPPYVQQVTEGFRAVRDIPIAMGCILVGMSWGLAGGGYNILVSYIGSVVYEMGPAGIGLLYTIDGVGILAGSWVVAGWIRDDMDRALTWFGAAYLFQGLFFALFAAIALPVPGALAFFLMRAASGIIIPLDTALLQRSVPPHLLGRVFSLHGATYSGVMQLSMLFTGLLVDRLGTVWTGTALGSVAALGGAAFLLALRSGRLSARSSATES